MMALDTFLMPFQKKSGQHPHDFIPVVYRAYLENSEIIPK